MANNFDSNTSKKVMRSFLAAFESERVLSKNVNTQLFQGQFTPATGDTVFVKRPTDYTTKRTPDGDVSGETKNDILTGQAQAKAQDYFTVFMDVDEVDNFPNINIKDASESQEDEDSIYMSDPDVQVQP